MYESVRIQNFRGFEDLRVDGLTRVNLIVGGNNVGKTAVLEAVSLLASVGEVEAADYINYARSLPRPYQASDTTFHSLFHEFQLAEPVVIEARRLSGPTDRVEVEAAVGDGLPYVAEEAGDSGEHRADEADELPPERELLRVRWLAAGVPVASGSARMIPRRLSGGRVSQRLEFRSDGRGPWPRTVFLPTRTRSALGNPAAQFTDLVQRGHKTTLVSALRVIDSRITDAELLLYEGETIVHADTSTSRKMPLGLLGDGSVRLCTIAMSIGSAAGGVAAIDELDTGIYYAALENAWKLVGTAARDFGTQVFATTHSEECMLAAYEAFAASPDDIMFHRLERVAGTIRCKTFDHRTFGNALTMGVETR